MVCFNGSLGGTMMRFCVVQRSPSFTAFWLFFHCFMREVCLFCSSAMCCSRTGQSDSRRCVLLMKIDGGSSVRSVLSFPLCLPLGVERACRPLHVACQGRVE